MNPLVSVTIVTYHSGRYIGRCLESILAQDYQPLEIIVVDNSSRDDTAEILSKYAGRIRLLWNERNAGFSAAQNQAIRMARGRWVLALNPDVILCRDFLSRLMEAGQADPSAGTVCGRLLVLPATLEIPARPQIDSAGLYFTPTLRHFDRGSRQADNGEYNRPEYVFGATAAAALYRREMIEDISPEGEFFDEDFFVYREDADVSWRAQLLGWKCRYVPEARGYHARTALPENRASLPPEINMHSVKNRFLMRIKNITAGLYLRYFLPITARDLCVLGYCLLVERSSLEAFRLVARNWRRALAKRRWILGRRRVSDHELARWFRYRPVAEPAPEVRLAAAAAAASHRGGLAKRPAVAGRRGDGASLDDGLGGFATHP